jgi:NAD-dependent DNA ligase
MQRLNGGKVFVVSGVFEILKRRFKKSIEDNGGKVGSSISTKPIMFLLEIIWGRQVGKKLLN